MAHPDMIPNARRRWPSSTPTSPPARSLRLPPTAGTSSTTSRLAPYNHGSLITTVPTSRPVDSRKIRNDIGDEEEQEIRMAFEVFDSRMIGKHNCGDLKVAMRALDFEVTKAEVRKLMEEYCKDGSDEVNQDEFIDILTAKYKEKDPDEDLAKAFRFFDEDNTGKISLKNLRKIVRDLGEHITEAEMAAMIDEFDKDGDGQISESEFFGIMKRDRITR